MPSGEMTALISRRARAMVYFSRLGLRIIKQWVLPLSPTSSGAHLPNDALSGAALGAGLRWPAPDPLPRCAIAPAQVHLEPDLP